ncbi:hypothetical protein EST38_g7275 [Candolleomyces aberdarensis]|uniref:C2H2-type domain-containing protein n=1 Tax=Candolleomyces aberdarensis TaxID=2316362 RepID=A0A4Q2DHR6_9AGAR|nr:hypothetical protein EST38_g7275 [Candolleomyces aberdarensis]
MAWCDTCDRYFPTRFSLIQHLRSSSLHNWCEECDVDFDSWVGLKEHWVQSPQHDYCQYCNEHFGDYDDYADHNDQFHAWCRPCHKFFRNDLGLHEHRRQSPVHSSRYCVPCKQLFQSEANLHSHMNSSIHRPRDIVCPGHNCNATFVSQSALILHLEAGTCRSGINRAIVNRVVRERDTNNIITDPSRLLTGPGSGGRNSEVTYSATGAAWNGYAYECYLCHNEFHSLPALNQHLASPRHLNKAYICPLSSCRERFNTLSGLCQHIESERCGVLRFAPVRQALDGFVSGMRTITAY